MQQGLNSVGFTLLKATAVTACVVLFCILMADVWNKFSKKMTSTGIQYEQVCNLNKIPEKNQNCTSLLQSIYPLFCSLNVFQQLLVCRPSSN